MEGLVEAQRRLSAAAKARKVSLRSLQRHRKQLARRHAKIAARRKDFLHKVSADLVSRHRLIATEGLDVGNMTRAAKGCKQCPGKNVAQKSGLNRAILDTAPSNFLKMLRYKAEEAGVEFLEAPTRKLKPSQSCPACGAQKRKTLSQRQHICECGCSLGRDEAAACVLLQWGLTEEARLKTLSGERDKAAGTAADQALI
jgi:putative transposase